MLQNLRRYFYANKNKVMKYILIVVFGILIIQFMNNYVATKSNEEVKISVNNEFTYGNLINFGNTTDRNNTAITNQVQNQIFSNVNIDNNTVVGGSNIVNNIFHEGSFGNEEINKENNDENIYKKTLTEYLNFCMNKNTEKAYEMLTEECKKVLFPNLELFNKNYISVIFNGDKIYEMENYMGHTYKVKIMDNMTTTGIYTPLSYTEYISIEYSNGNYKLNINNYIGRFSCNGVATDENITVKINYKDVFMDYEKYNITINNNSDKTIKITDNSKLMYASDNKGNKYYANIHELGESSLIVRSGSSSNINIKYIGYYTVYTNQKNQLVFNDIILDYDSYRKIENKSDYKDRGIINVQIQ